MTNQPHDRHTHQGYVLCSLRETRSSTAIEQIVGRILRLPGARSKQHPDLNCAYALSISDNIHEVLAELCDALESNSFTTVPKRRFLKNPSLSAVPPLFR